MKRLEKMMFEICFGTTLALGFLCAGIFSILETYYKHYPTDDVVRQSKREGISDTFFLLSLLFMILHLIVIWFV